MRVREDPAQNRTRRWRRWAAASAALAVAIAAVLVALLPHSTTRHRRQLPQEQRSHPSVGQPGQLFAANSVWNAPVSANAPVDPASKQLVQNLVAQVNAEETSNVGPWIATSSASTPIYIVPANTPTVRVALVDPGLSWRSSLARAFEKVPIPPGAQPARGSDRHMTIWQPSTNRLWEFFHASHDASGWQAAWGGAMQDVSTNPGYYTPAAWPGAQYNWGATATSLPVAAGVIRLSEIKASAIRHALALDLPHPRAGVLAWPAERSDGTGSTGSLPEGAHLRLDPSLNLSRLPMPPLVRMIAVAAQRYGLIVRDGAPAVSLFVEDPTQYGGRKLIWGKRGIFGGQTPQQLLARFPWSHLEVLRMNLRAAPRSTKFLEH